MASARGNPTLRMMSRGLAPSERSTSSISGLHRAPSPVATFTAIGKKTHQERGEHAPDTTTDAEPDAPGPAPPPTLGIELKPTSMG